MKKSTIIFAILFLAVLVAAIYYGQKYSALFSPLESEISEDAEGQAGPAGSSPKPSIIQVTPVGLKLSSNQQNVNVQVWGEQFDSNALLLIDGVDFTSRLTARQQNKLELTLTRAEAVAARIFTVINPNNVRSNDFNTRGTTYRFPEIVDIEPVAAQPTTSNIILKGHNFFSTQSKLFIDRALVQPTAYTLTPSPDGSFSLSIDPSRLPAPLATGHHTVYFSNPPRFPEQSLERLSSNIISFYVLSSPRSDIVFDNANLRLVFDGTTGSLKSLTHLATGYQHNFGNLYPWRMEVRKLLDRNQLTQARNPLLEHFFNPLEMGCVDRLTTQSSASGSSKTLTIKWSNCTIDAANSFDFEQTYTLKDGQDFFDMSYAILNPRIVGYGLRAIHLYSTIQETPAQEWGIVATNSIDAYREPGTSLKTRGGRDLCVFGASVPSLDCGNPTEPYKLSEFFYTPDGDGFKLFNYMDFVQGWWDENSNYLFTTPLEALDNSKYYSYEGQFGLFKSTAVTLVGNDFSPASFSYRLPYSFRTFAGKSTTFTGEETVIHLADIFRETQRELGTLQTPFVKRDISPFLKNLDLMAIGFIKDFFTYDSNGNIIGVSSNPGYTKIAQAYGEAKRYYGAGNSFLLTWTGDLDNRQGQLALQPIPGITLPFYQTLQKEGWMPCFYTLYQAMADRDVQRLNLRAQVGEEDPAGNPMYSNSYGGEFIFNPRSISLSTPSQLSWLLERYRALNNNKKGAKCFYMDNIANQPSLYSGMWSRFYGDTGFSPSLQQAYHNYLTTLSNEVRRIDDDGFYVHESFLHTSNKKGAVPISAAPQTFPVISDDPQLWSKYLSQAFILRVFSGYTDYLLSQAIINPAGPPYYYPEASHLPIIKNAGLIPQSYDKTVEETYLLSASVGFLRNGAIPVSFEVAANRDGGYKPLSQIRQANQGFVYRTGEWATAFESYAELLKTQVAARKLAREYFQGLWHPPLVTDSPREDYYFFYDWVRVASRDPSALYKFSEPRVLSIVRQPFDTTADRWANTYGLLFFNTYKRTPSETVTFTFSYQRYGLTPGTSYDLFLKTSTGRAFVRTVTTDFNHTFTIPSGEFRLFELVPRAG